jgi:hypothetical protein
MNTTDRAKLDRLAPIGTNDRDTARLAAIEHSRHRYSSKMIVAPYACVLDEALDLRPAPLF